jgi:hypothetical protein
MTDEFEEAVTRLVVDSWENLDEVLKRLSGSETELNPAVDALIFGLLGGFARGFMEARVHPDNTFEHWMSHGLGCAMSDPRVDSLIQMTLSDAVDEKVGGMIDS